jgi:hypothetical protein
MLPAIIETHFGLHAKSPFFPILINFDFLDVQENPQTNFTSIRPVGTALILAGRQTDMMKIIDAITHNSHVKLFALPRALNMEGHKLLRCRRFCREWIGRVVIPVLKVPYTNH